MATSFDYIVCADWGKQLRKRSVYLADVRRRTVSRAPPEGWNLSRVLALAARLNGRCLVGFDVPIGAPRSLVDSLFTKGVLRERSFLALLNWLRGVPAFFAPVSSPAHWQIEQPFFAVPPGNGTLKSFEVEARKHGVELRREVEKRTYAKSPFVVAGIPGTVGSSVCSLWSELSELILREPDYPIWPFVGSRVLSDARPVLAEIYPRAAYAIALAEGEPAGLSRLSVTKTEMVVRAMFIERLKGLRWLAEEGVVVNSLDCAIASEDDFDAAVTSTALLRLVLNGKDPCALGTLVDAASEGGMLGLGALDFARQEETFASGSAASPRRASNGKCVSHNRASANIYTCPIPGCSKQFSGSRGGWDAHVESLRLHPAWHPEICSREERKRVFHFEFPEFFRV